MKLVKYSLIHQQLCWIGSIFSGGHDPCSWDVKVGELGEKKMVVVF